MRADEIGADANGWRPIETAPRDGTDILAAGRYGPIRVARWDEKAPSLYSGVPGSWRANVYTFVELELTHWQPLPNPPEPA